MMRRKKHSFPPSRFAVPGYVRVRMEIRKGRGEENITRAAKSPEGLIARK